MEAEHRAASSVKDTKSLSYKEWAAEVTRVLCRFEDLLWPDLFIAGGGISRKHEKWIPVWRTARPSFPPHSSTPRGSSARPWPRRTAWKRASLRNNFKAVVTMDGGRL